MLFRLTEAMEAGTLPRDLLMSSAAGTGKTYGILAWLHCLAADWPRLRVLICRQTRASLTESVLVTYEQGILPADGMEEIAAGSHRRQRQSYLYPDTRSEIVVGGLDDPQRILSTDWDIIYVNEAIEVQLNAWEMLASRLNRPGRDPRWGYLLGDTNPGHPAHWLLRRRADGLTTFWRSSHKANPAFFDAEAGEWTPAWWRYKSESLDKLTGTRRLRLRDDKWATGEGVWFNQFDQDIHVTADAEYDPALPVCLAVDVGVETGAVLMQFREAGGLDFVNVFADYYSNDVPAYRNAEALLALVAARCPNPEVDHGADPQMRLAWRVADPAGGARNPVGVTTLAEYHKAGLSLGRWPVGPVADGLGIIERLLEPLEAPGGRKIARLSVHPRCRHLADAFGNYARAKRQNQLMDYPEDPQHPFEDLMDALRGGLYFRFKGRSVR